MDLLILIGFENLLRSNISARLWCVNDVCVCVCVYPNIPLFEFFNHFNLMLKAFEI